MAIQTSTELKTLDVAADGQPFVCITGSYGAQPGPVDEWVLDAQPFFVAPDSTSGGLVGGYFLVG